MPPKRSKNHARRRLVVDLDEHRTGATTVDGEILEAHRDRIKADSALG